jgi:hypothetical protein
MVKKKYKAVKGSTLTDKDAQVVGERINYLTTIHSGEITPREVLDDARSNKSPLHKYFDWNDESAAEKYRIIRARKLLGAVVEVIITKGVRKDQRSFFNVTNKQGNSVFVTNVTVRQEPNYLEELISNAQDEIKQLSECLTILNQEYRQARKG